MNSTISSQKTKRLFGIIGFPLSHSFSQKYFSDKFQNEKLTHCEFKVFPTENIEELTSIITSNPSVSGLSVTIPHKQSVIALLDKMDELATTIGAVNCVKRKQLENGKWKLTGYNTDAFGFEGSIKPLLKSHHKRALILGTGGASKAIAFSLKKLGIEFNFVSRTALSSNCMTYENLNKTIIETHSIIINTTPLGMFPNINGCPPIPYENISSTHLLFDLNYNPEVTLFLQKGKDKLATIKNGLEMLHLQAEKSWEIWNS